MTTTTPNTFLIGAGPVATALAGALRLGGVPVLGLFGPTVEAFGYFPTGAGSRVFEREIGCRPCSRNGSRRCPKGTQECLVEVPVAPVERALADLLEKRGDSRYVLQ